MLHVLFYILSIMSVWDAIIFKACIDIGRVCPEECLTSRENEGEKKPKTYLIFICRYLKDLPVFQKDLTLNFSRKED